MTTIQPYAMCRGLRFTGLIGCISMHSYTLIHSKALQFLESHLLHCLLLSSLHFSSCSLLAVAKRKSQDVPLTSPSVPCGIYL